MKISFVQYKEGDFVLNLYNPKQINDAFCMEVGIQKIKYLLINEITGAYRYSLEGMKIKKPRTWKETKEITLEKPIYPNFLLAENFIKLLNIQWELFGSFDKQYVRIQKESFPVNYLYCKIRALQTIKTYGGSEMAEEYKKLVRAGQYTLGDINENISGSK